MLLVPGIAHGQETRQREAADTTVVLPVITVEAERTTASADATARLTQLDAAALNAASTVADALEARTGLYIKRYGPSGAASLSLRGSSANQTLLLLDGQRLADPQTGQVDLTLVPTLLLASADVLHGAASAQYGSDGVGGVVQLRTVTPKPGLTYRLGGHVGAYGTRQAGALVGMGNARYAALVAVEASTSDGDFPYTNSALFPAEEQQRLGASRSMRSLYGKIRRTGSRSTHDVSLWHNTAERGLPGPGNAAPIAAQQDDGHLRLTTQSTWRLSQGTLTVNAFGQTTRLRYVPPTIDEARTSRTRAAALRAEMRRATGMRWLLAGGAEIGYEAADLADGVDQQRGAAFVHATGVFGRLQVVPALRADVLTGTGPTLTAVSPSLGINLQPLASSGLRLKAQVGGAFRAPTFNERFWVPGGNPDLRAERGWSGDLGVFIPLHQRVATEVTVFLSRIDDQIVWHPSFVGQGVQVWRPGNLARVATHGLEWSLAMRPMTWGDAFVEGRFDYTMTRALDRSDPRSASYGHPLRYQPLAQLKTFVGLGWRSLRLDVTARFMGVRYLTTDASQALDPHQVVDVRMQASRAVAGARLTLGLTLENALDATYEVIRFYPMPPRHARFRLVLEHL